MKIEVGGHTFDLGRKVCETCGRGIHHARRGPHAKGYWQHNSDMAGIHWKRELARRAG